MEVHPKNPPRRGPDEWFTGEVWIEPIAQGEGPPRARVSAVSFTPGARTAWHSHGLGQTLYVTDGRGLVQTRGEEIVSIATGDIIHTPAGELHWHGASPDHRMTHLTITESDPSHEGPDTDWGDHVSDDEYSGETR